MPTALSRSELTLATLVALFTRSIPLFFSSSTCALSLTLASGNKSALSISSFFSLAACLIASIAELLASLTLLASLSASRLIALIIPTALSRSELTLATLAALLTASSPLFFSSSTFASNLVLASGNKSALLISRVLSSAAFLIASIAVFLASERSLVSFAFLSASKLIPLIIPTALLVSALTLATVVALFTRSIPLFFSAST